MTKTTMKQTRSCTAVLRQLSSPNGLEAVSCDTGRSLPSLCSLIPALPSSLIVRSPLSVPSQAGSGAVCTHTHTHTRSPHSRACPCSSCRSVKCLNSSPARSVRHRNPLTASRAAAAAAAELWQSCLGRPFVWRLQLPGSAGEHQGSKQPASQRRAGRSLLPAAASPGKAVS